MKATFTAGTTEPRASRRTRRQRALRVDRGRRQTAWAILLRSQPERYAIFAWLRVVVIRTFLPPLP
jgi:hypothetical protein